MSWSLKIIFQNITVRKFCLDLVVVDLQRRICRRSCEPDDVISAVVDLGVHLADDVVVTSGIVSHKHVSVHLKWETKFNLSDYKIVRMRLL